MKIKIQIDRKGRKAPVMTVEEASGPGCLKATEELRKLSVAGPGGIRRTDDYDGSGSVWLNQSSSI